jgi:hypothetical protein
MLAEERAYATQIRSILPDRNHCGGQSIIVGGSARLRLRSMRLPGEVPESLPFGVRRRESRDRLLGL